MPIECGPAPQNIDRIDRVVFGNRFNNVPINRQHKQFVWVRDVKLNRLIQRGDCKMAGTSVWNLLPAVSNFPTCTPRSRQNKPYEKIRHCRVSEAMGILLSENAIDTDRATGPLLPMKTRVAT